MEQCQFDKIDDQVVLSLKKYKVVHPLMFMYSLERTKDKSSLFDVLDSFQNNYPVCWDNEWVSTNLF